MKHVELIIDYLIDGEDFQYFDNTGKIVRCKDCKHYSNGHLCQIFSRHGTIETKDDDYCSYGDRGKE